MNELTMENSATGPSHEVGESAAPVEPEPGSWRALEEASPLPKVQSLPPRKPERRPVRLGGRGQPSRKSRANPPNTGLDFPWSMIG
jgi:hypothetical protein